jgi:tetratricopeptide (TPR) repeat protein
VQTPARDPRATTRPWLVFIVLALVTLAAYQPAWHGGMLWDDDMHLTPAVLASWTGLARIWTDVNLAQQYYPVANTAFWAMNRVWGHDPLGYHVVNVLLHALSAFLLWGMLRRWSVPGAVVAAAVFALHPVQVESVAWMTELKNTLSGAFYFLAAAAYLRFDDTRKWRWYAIAFALFALALGSKTVTATLPAALLVVWWWRRGRIDVRRDVLPLVPLFAMGIAAGLGTAWLEVNWVGAQGASFDLTGVERILLAGRAAWFYASKIVWPAPLIFSYPRWSIDQAVWWQYLFPAALAIGLAGLWMARRWSRAPLAVALLFLGTLLPALGFVNVFPFRYSYVADHFQYLACASVIAGLAAGLVQLVARWRPGVSEIAIALLVGAPLFVLTFRQSGQYVDPQTLYRATIAGNPSSVLARNNLATELLEGPAAGWAEAQQQAEEAVRLAPDDASPRNNVGLALYRAGRREDAMREFREAIRLNPTLAAAHYNLGMVLAELGKPDESIAAYEESLRIFPSQPEALHNLANQLALKGRFPEAIARFRDAVRLAPQSADIRLNLANALQATGAFDEAIAVYRDAIRLHPGDGKAEHNLGMALGRAGRQDEALAAFREAERLMPGSPLVEMSLGNLLASTNQKEAMEEAMVHYEHALQSPEMRQPAEVHNELGVVFAKLGRMPEAIAHFTEAVRLNPDLAAARANLARARQGR